MTLLDLVQQTGIYPKRVASTGGGEFHSSCPVCGGSDRFYIQPYRQMTRCLGAYRCRQCNIYGDSIQFARQFLNYSFQEAVQKVNSSVSYKYPLISSNSCTNFRPPLLKAPSKEWIEQATNFVHQSYKNLCQHKEITNFLARRGLPLEAIHRYKLGWSNHDNFFSKRQWGLPEDSLNHKPGSLWIPQGLIIPSWETNGQVVRIKVRRHTWKEGDKLPKYVAISGSMNGLTLIGSIKNTTVIVVESELDAYAIDYIAHDFACVVAVGSNTKNPDNVTDLLAKRSKHLLICHDNDQAGKKMLAKWRNLYPHARAYPTPAGKDIGEAIQEGFGVREWLLRAL